MSESFITPRTVACQAPPFKGFPRQENWSGLPFLLQEMFLSYLGTSLIGMYLLPFCYLLSGCCCSSLFFSYSLSFFPFGVMFSFMLVFLSLYFFLASIIQPPSHHIAWFSSVWEASFETCCCSKLTVMVSNTVHNSYVHSHFSITNLHFCFSF